MSNYANLESVSIPWLFAESVSNLWKQSTSNYKEDCNWSGPRLSLHEFHVWPLKINLFHAPTLAGKIAKIWHCCRHGICAHIRHPTQINTRLSLKVLLNCNSDHTSKFRMVNCHETGNYIPRGLWKKRCSAKHLIFIFLRFSPIFRSRVPWPTSTHLKFPLFDLFIWGFILV